LLMINHIELSILHFLSPSFFPLVSFFPFATVDF
jgi:hypothetical protein